MQPRVNRTSTHADVSRRTFMKQSVVTAAALTLGSRVHAGGPDALKVGLIGCGGRGTGAATQALMATKTPV